MRSQALAIKPGCLPVVAGSAVAYMYEGILASAAPCSLLESGLCCPGCLCSYVASIAKLKQSQDAFNMLPQDHFGRLLCAHPPGGVWGGVLDEQKCCYHRAVCRLHVAAVLPNLTGRHLWYGQSKGAMLLSAVCVQGGSMYS